MQDMIITSEINFYIILMTKKLSKQTKFYQEILGLDIIFNSKEAIALGKNNRIFILLKQDLSENSHHLTEHKGPSIMTFKMPADINLWTNKIESHGLKVRDHLLLPEYNSSYLFIEDYDSNEICLEFMEV